MGSVVSEIGEEGEGEGGGGRVEGGDGEEVGGGVEEGAGDGLVAAFFWMRFGGGECN